MVRRECWERLYIYLLSLYIFYHFYYLQPKLLHVGIILFYLLHLGTCGYPSDTRPLNNILKF